MAHAPQDLKTLFCYNELLSCPVVIGPYNLHMDVLGF